jgi:hypothetical protein
MNYGYLQMTQINTKNPVEIDESEFRGSKMNE